jgi:hypothetical protein
VEVELPDGSIAEFPDDMSQDKISEAIKSHLSSKTSIVPVNPQIGSPGADIPPTTPTQPSPELARTLARMSQGITSEENTGSVLLRDLENASKRGLSSGAGSLLEGMAASGTPNVRKPYTGTTFLGIPIPQTPQERAMLKPDQAATAKAVQENPLFQAGQSLRKTAAGIEEPAPSLLNKAVETGAEMLPVAASGEFAPAVIGISAYGDAFENQYQQSKNAGLSDEEAATRAISSASKDGLTQAAIWTVLPRPLKAFLGKATGIAGEGAVKQFVARRIAGAGEGAVLGAASQAGGNVATGQPVTQNVVPAAVGMAGLGAATMGPEPRKPVPSVIDVAATVLPQAAAEARESLKTKGGEKNAISEIEKQKSVQRERETGDGGGKAAETSGGDSLQRAAEGGTQPPGSPQPQPTKSEVALNLPEITDEHLTETAATGQPLNVGGKKAVSASYFHTLGDKASDPDAWVKIFEDVNAKRDKLYPQETAYQIGLFLRQLGKDKAQPVIEALMEARKRLVAKSKAGDFAAGFLAQFPREAIEAAHNEGSAIGTISNDLAKPIERTEVKPSAEEKEKKEGNEVLTPAVRTDEGVFSGQKRHNEIVLDQAKKGVDLMGGERGFLYKGKFIDRAEAAKIYEQQTGKKPVMEGQLHSEDLINTGYFKEKAAQPAAAAAPKRYKIGTSPQTYVEVGRPEPSESEKANGEVPVDVRNEKTGVVSTVMESDLKEVKTPTEKPAAAKQNLDDQLLKAGLDPSVFPNAASKRAALKRQVAIGAGPGAATAPGAVGATDIGAMETNLPPLEKLADAIKRFPKQKGGGWREKLRQWMDDVGIPTKDYVSRALVGMKAAAAHVVDAFTKLAPVSTMDRAVGDWNLADTEGDIAARRFVKAVKERFPDRSKLRAFSNWINAGGDKELLQRQADLTADPELKKTYTDALNFGPEEEKLGADIKQYHDEMLAEAMRAGALEEGLENYIHRYYPREDDPARKRLEGTLNEMRFTKNFSGFKRRFYDSDFEAEQAGLKPEKDAAKRILAYDQGFRKALTARAFVKDRYKATMPDGRPELDIAGVGIPSKTDVETGKETPYLIKPKSKAGGDSPEDYRGDYVTFDHPAFRRWKWVGSDADGKPILMEGEVAVHPDAVKKYRALFERSWFQKNPIGRALLIPSSFVKQTMLAASAFHPVQIGVHAMEHRTNPFNLVDLNTRDPAQADLIKGGLVVSDMGGANHFSEGVSGSGLFGKIPIIGEMVKSSQDWLFKDFIPRIKMTMALDALERNRKTYAKDLESGKITDEQLIRLTGREANAAFGEQNYRAMFRSKGFQDVLRFMFLAPDFGEARLRFPLQAITKYGGEQRMALTLGALGMFVAAKTAEKLITGKMNLSKPFSVTVDNREYGLRNVASDLYHMITDPAGYIRNRLNPIYTRPVLEMLSGRDAFGRKRGAKQQALDEAKQIIPIGVRGAAERDQSLWESFINAIGLTEHRASAFGQAMKAINQWKEKKGYTAPGEFVYDSDKDPYSKLTTALTYGSPGDARKQLDALTAGKTPAEARKIAQHYRRSLAEHPYLTGSRAHEQEYIKSLDASGKAQYDEAKAERKAMWQKFVKIYRSKYPPQQ